MLGSGFIMDNKELFSDEINKLNYKVSEPSKREKTDYYRTRIGNALKEIGFERSYPIRQHSPGYNSYEKYKLDIEEYNIKILCGIGSEAIEVGLKDAEKGSIFHIISYKKSATYKFARNTEYFISEFKYLVRYSIIRYLVKVRKMINIPYYEFDISFEKSSGLDAVSDTDE